jgi:hypothetical protein
MAFSIVSPPTLAAGQPPLARHVCPGWYVRQLLPGAARLRGYIANRTEAAKAWIWNSNVRGRWAGYVGRLFRDGAAGCLEVG